MSTTKRQLVFSAALTVGVFFVLFLGSPLTIVQLYYLSISLVGGGIFAWDKFAAVSGRGRIAEKVIVTLGAVGAGLAILALMEIIRHKTLKGSFIFSLSLFTALHLLLFWGLSTYVIN